MAQVDERFVSSAQSNITVAPDLNHEFALEVTREGNNLTQVVSFSQFGSKIYEVTFLGQIDELGLVTLQSRNPPTPENQGFMNHYINKIIYAQGFPNWYRLSSVESMCLLETRGDSPQYSLLFPNFSQISFSSRVNSYLSLNSRQQATEEILPLLTICNGLLSFVKSEEDLDSDFHISERSTVLGLFLWKSLEVFISKVQKIYSFFDKRSTQGLDIKHVLDCLRDIVADTPEKNYYERFFDPWVTALEKFSSAETDALKLHIYGESIKLLSKIQVGLKSFAVIDSAISLEGLRKLVLDSKQYLPEHDSCLDPLIKLFLTDSLPQTDDKLWDFVASKYKQLLRLNSHSKVLESDPICKRFATELFSLSEGFCACVANTINPLIRYSPQFSTDLWPKTSDPKLNDAVIGFLDDQSNVDGYGHFFANRISLQVYGDWIIKRGLNKIYALNVVDLRKIEIASPGEIKPSDTVDDILIALEVTHQNGDTPQSVKISWFDLKWLQESKRTEKIDFKFQEDVNTFYGHMINCIIGVDNYVLILIEGETSCYYRVKLGQQSEQIPELHTTLNGVPLHYFKGTHLICATPGSDFKSGTIDETSAILGLHRINPDYSVELVDKVQLDLAQNLTRLRSPHSLPRDNLARYNRIEFFTHRNSCYMFLFFSSPTPQFRLWHIKHNSKFELVSKFESISKQMTRYLKKNSLGILDLSGQLELNSNSVPLSLFLMLTQSETPTDPQKGVTNKSRVGGAKLKFVKIDLKLR